jgi:hypothetical protein
MSQPRLDNLDILHRADSTAALVKTIIHLVRFGPLFEAAESTCSVLINSSGYLSTGSTTIQLPPEELMEEDNELGANEDPENRNGGDDGDQTLDPVESYPLEQSQGSPDTYSARE